MSFDYENSNVQCEQCRACDAWTIVEHEVVCKSCGCSPRDQLVFEECMSINYIDKDLGTRDDRSHHGPAINIFDNHSPYLGCSVAVDGSQLSKIVSRCAKVARRIDEDEAWMDLHKRKPAELKDIPSLIKSFIEQRASDMINVVNKFTQGTKVTLEEINETATEMGAFYLAVKETKVLSVEALAAAVYYASRRTLQIEMLEATLQLDNDKFKHALDEVRNIGSKSPNKKHKELISAIPSYTNDTKEMIFKRTCGKLEQMRKILDKKRKNEPMKFVEWLANFKQMNSIRTVQLPVLRKAMALDVVAMCIALRDLRIKKEDVIKAFEAIYAPVNIDDVNKILSAICKRRGM